MPVKLKTPLPDMERMMKTTLTIILFLFAGLTSCNSSDFSGASPSGATNSKNKNGKGKADSGDPSDREDGDSDYDGDSGDSDSDGGSEGSESGSGNDNDDDDLGEDDDESGNLSVETEEKVNCKNTGEKIDSAGLPFDFQNEGEVRDFVNQRCKTGISAQFHGAGAVGSDEATAKAVCNLKGYENATVLETSKYSSPHNNFIAYWEDGQTKFLLDVATKRNSKIKRLQCTGKFKKQCHDDKKQIDCAF